jgi:hypothetical protein
MKLLLLTILLISLLNLAVSYDLEDYKKLVWELSQNEAYVASYEQNVKDLLAEDPNYFDYTPSQKFNCDVSEMKSAEQPTSVHALRPGDVQVVSAMGDSITAACGANANTILGLLIEYRARSWSIGGKSNVNNIVSLPNVLKKFNPDLKGYNTRPSILLADGVGFNAAISGSVADDLPAQVYNNSIYRVYRVV